MTLAPMKRTASRLARAPRPAASITGHCERVDLTNAGPASFYRDDATHGARARARRPRPLPPRPRSRARDRALRPAATLGPGAGVRHARADHPRAAGLARIGPRRARPARARDGWRDARAARRRERRDVRERRSHAPKERVHPRARAGGRGRRVRHRPRRSDGGCGGTPRARDTEGDRRLERRHLPAHGARPPRRVAEPRSRARGRDARGEAPTQPAQAGTPARDRGALAAVARGRRADPVAPLPEPPAEGHCLPSVTSMTCSALSRYTVRRTRSPGRNFSMRLFSGCSASMGWSLTLVTTSPWRNPACTAGEPEMTWVMSTPETVDGRPMLAAARGVICW